MKFENILIKFNCFTGSVEQSPRMSHFPFENSDNFGLGSGETQLREDLADAMKESPGGALIDAGKFRFFFRSFFFHVACTF